MDAEADSQRGIRRFTRDADDLTKVSLDMAAHAGDSHGGNDIYKAGRMPQALTDTLFRGRSDHLDDIDAIRIRKRTDLSLLFKRKIRDDDAVDADLLRFLKETSRWIIEDRIVIGEEHDRDLCLRAERLHQLHDLRQVDMVLQRLHIRFHDDRPVSDGIGERHADLDQVHACFFQIKYIFHGIFHRRDTCRQESDHRLPLLECFTCMAHR